MSQFCKDCKHSNREYGHLVCEKSRFHGVDQVTGRKWSHVSGCETQRSGRVRCWDFEPKPTLIERLKEVFS